jgi:hypothetical protein
MEPLYPPQEPRSDDQSSRMAAREAEIRLRSPQRRTREVDVSKVNTGPWLNSPQRRSPAQVSLVYGNVHSRAWVVQIPDLPVTLSLNFISLTIPCFILMEIAIPYLLYRCDNDMSLTLGQWHID